jgi:hypothetical protein
MECIGVLRCYECCSPQAGGVSRHILHRHTPADIQYVHVKRRHLTWKPLNLTWRFAVIIRQEDARELLQSSRALLYVSIGGVSRIHKICLQTGLCPANTKGIDRKLVRRSALKKYALFS